MAVYKRNYGRFRGDLTPAWSRFLILPRYAYRDVFQSRGFIAFFTLCFALPFAGLLMIYLHHNLAALKFMNLPLDTPSLPERASAEIQDLLVDPKDPARMYLVEMKSDRLVRVRFRPKEWALEVEKVVSLATESFRSATQWMVWLP